MATLPVPDSGRTDGLIVVEGSGRGARCVRRHQFFNGRGALSSPLYGQNTMEAVGGVSGDGWPDIALANPAADFVEVRSGLDGTRIFSIEAPSEALSFGTAICPFRDFDRDSSADFLVGAKHSGEPDWPGIVSLVSGCDGRVLRTLTRAVWIAVEGE